MNHVLVPVLLAVLPGMDDTPAVERAKCNEAGYCTRFALNWARIDHALKTAALNGTPTKCASFLHCPYCGVEWATIVEPSRST